MLPRFIQDFHADFAQVIRADEPFAFSRFHDGEYAICQGIDYDAKSGWSVPGPTWLQHPLMDALTEAELDAYYLGISPPCDFSEGASWYRSQVKVPKMRLTFATLFQHANFKKLPQLLKRFDNPVLVACQNADIQVPANGVRKGWDLDAVVRKLLAVQGRPIFVAAGPCSNVIIHRYWKQQDRDRRVTIIDIGSALDRDIHGRATRPYHEANHPMQRHKCDWEDWRPFQPMTGKRRERAMRKQAQNEVFRQLKEDGFTETTGSKEQRTTIVRRGGPGITSPAIRDREPSNSGNRNVRIRPNKNKRR